MASSARTTAFHSSTQLNSARRWYSELWESDEAPALEQFLESRWEGCSADERTALFRELLSVDLYHRRRSGTPPTVEEYRRRFPAYAEIVSEQFDGYETLAFSDDTNSTSDTPASSAASSVRPDSFVARYRLIEMIGGGGFGEVWRAYDEKLQSEVAVKCPRRESPAGQTALEEARRQRRLRCPGFVPVLDVIEEQGQLFIVMELMEGGSLRRFTAPGSLLPCRTVAELAAEVAEALHEAHQRDHVHRDIKPDNILLDAQGSPKIADLGLAASEQELGAEAEMVVGTVNFMSPEQAEGQSHLVDGRTDIFSLGAVLYALLAGRPPYEAKSLKDYRRLLRKPGGPRPPRTVAAGREDEIPEALERICLKCLEPQLRDRYATSGDVARELRLLLRQQDEAAAPAARHSRLPELAAGCFALLAIVAGLWALRPDSPPAPPAPAGGAAAAAGAPPVEPPADNGTVVAQSFETLAPGQIKRRTWYPLLNRRPELLMGVDSLPFLSMTHDDASKSLVASGAGISMLSLGTVAVDDFQWELELHQSGWRRLGLFFGADFAADEPDSAKRTFHLLRLSRNPRTQRLLWSRTVENHQRMPDGEWGFGPPQELTAADAALPERLFVPLRIVVRAGRLAEFHWDGEPLPKLCQKSSGDEHPVTGKLGVMLPAESIQVQGARIKLTK